jgi:hypothetical protein
MSLQLGRGGAMRVSTRPDEPFEILCRSNRPAPLRTSRVCGGEFMSLGEGRCYLGSWAEQRVVARLATNRTRKATRITTTPPTVSRSQRSEPLRTNDSCLPVITLVLTSNSTTLTNECSDQDHRPTRCPSQAQTRIATAEIFPLVFQERRIA